MARASHPARLLLFISVSTATTAAAAAAELWRDASQPVPARVAALLPLLSQDEKLHQLLRPDGFSPAWAATGLGVLEMGGVFAGARSPSEAAAARNAVVQQCLAAGPGAALGLPPSFRTLATHGSEAFGVVFPQGPALGASFDAPLVRAVAAAGAAETRALGIDLYTSVIHMVADARFGRQEEGFSEEPMLTGAMAAASVAGAQGGLGVAADAYILAPSAPALLKHVGAYGAPAGGLNAGRADASEHRVRDHFLKPWRAAALAGSRGAMPSHNTLLGCPAHGSQWLLSGVLRGEFGMNSSLILSDTGDVAALRAFRLCDDDASCAALALTAGVDIEQPPGTTFLALPEALQRGLATQADIDAAVARVLRHKFSAGLFDAPYVNASAADALVNTAEHRALAQTAAEEGCVLLKNEAAALPLRAGARLVVLGPNGGCGAAGSGKGAVAPLCDAQQAMLGNYQGGAPLSGVQTVADALAAPGLASSVAFVRGAEIDSGNASAVPAAVAAAQAPGVDAVVVVLGDSTGSCGEGRDRDDLDLPGSQLALLAALAAAQPRIAAPIVLVLVNGRAATFGAAAGNRLLDSVAALLVAWRPGQEGGAAIARLLFGLANPSGRLPNSWLRAVGQSGSGASPWLQERNGDWAGGVGAEGRGFSGYTNAANDASPLFAFGSGLSYTSFALSQLAVQPQPGNATFPLALSVRVANAGGVDGACVVLAFVQDPRGVAAGRVVRPWKRLVAFARVPVAAGAALTASVAVAADDLAFYDASMRLALQRGNYTLSVGLSSEDDAANQAGFSL